MEKCSLEIGQIVHYRMKLSSENNEPTCYAAIVLAVDKSNKINTYELMVISPGGRFYKHNVIESLDPLELDRFHRTSLDKTRF